MNDTLAPILPLELHRLCFGLSGQRIIDSVSLRLDCGTLSIMLGSNGAGKSVLMRLMHGLLTPTAGAMTWSGSPSRPSAQAMVFQRPVMLRTTVLKNVEYALVLAGVPRAQRRDRAMQSLASVGLLSLSERQARVLSGGEQQKLALARACATLPRILFLDEPTANLDPSTTAEIEALIVKVAASGTKIVMSTHSLGQASRLADDIIFMHCGRVIEHGPANSVLRSSRSKELRAYIKGEVPWVSDLP